MLQVSAATAGLGLVGAGASILAGDKKLARWRGIALGGEASMAVAHPDPKQAQAVLTKAVVELRRLEEVFSLYSPTSALSVLNESAVLQQPPAEMVMLLSNARQISQASSGVFDVTVQPLWDHYARASEADSDSLRQALSHVGQKRIHIASDKITLEQGQKMTLNGIAQGAITDHLTALFKREGFSDILLGTGEIRALGSKAGDEPWRVALGNREGPVIELKGGALASSEPVTSLSEGGIAHLYNPRSGDRESLYRRVSVEAATATLADGLSTALSLMQEAEWHALLDYYKGYVRAVYLESLDGGYKKFL